jgi:hypothetical protein
MNAPKCQYCGAGIEAYFSSMNEHVYKCGSFNYSAQASRTCHCREREAHNNTKRERDELLKEHSTLREIAEGAIMCASLWAGSRSSTPRKLREQLNQLK